MSENDHGLEFQDQSPTYQSDSWKAVEHDPLNDSGVVLTEESPIKVDDHAPAPSAHDSSGIGIVFEDRAHDYDPASDPEPPRPVATKPAAAPTPATPPLPKRRSASAPAVDLTRPGIAVCPACQAKNAAQATLCARCGGAIESATTPSGRLHQGGILKAEFAPRNRGPVDADLIPEHVHDQWRQQQVETDERMGIRRRHRKQVAKELAIATAVAFVIASFILGMALPGWLRGLFIVVDGGLGVGAAYLVFHQGFNRLQAGAVYGGIALLTHTFKLLVVVGLAMSAGNPAAGVGGFLLWLGTVGLTGFLGWGAGFQLEMQRWDQEI